MGINATTEEWAKGRGISRMTLEAFGVASGTMAMPDLGRVDVVCFPYQRGSEIVGVKYRAVGKKAFSQRPGGEQRFWNLDAVLLGPRRVAYIFEGEPDALAAYEAGISKEEILSVPNGAPPQEVENAGESDRYRYVRDGLAEGLSAVERFVLAVDGDGPGRALRQDLVKLLGPARCWFVEWPRGCKDANALLERGTPGELRDFLEAEAQVWPVEGIYTLSQLPEPPPIVVWRPGFPEWESKIGFAAGMVSVLTGYPGHGKTTLGMQLWYNVCREYDVRAAVASFETMPRPHHRRNLRQFYSGTAEVAMTHEEIVRADDWINDHFVWIAHPQRRPSFKWALDMAEVAVIRHGAKIVQLDPWNKLEADRPSGQRETDWIRDCLNEAMNFAKDFNVHFQIVAHPAKSQDFRQRKERPALEDISGSRHWDNIVDQGLSVFRPKIFEDGKRCTEASLYHLKCRFEELGYECKLDLSYDLQHRRYASADYETIKGLGA